MNINDRVFSRSPSMICSHHYHFTFTLKALFYLFCLSINNFILHISCSTVLVRNYYCLRFCYFFISGIYSVSVLFFLVAAVVFVLVFVSVSIVISVSFVISALFSPPFLSLFLFLLLFSFSLLSVILQLPPSFLPFSCSSALTFLICNLSTLFPFFPFLFDHLVTVCLLR